METWTQKALRLDQTKQNSLTAVYALLASFHWEDERWMVSDSGTECAEVSRVATLVSQSSAPADLKSPDVGMSSGGLHTDIPG